MANKGSSFLKENGSYVWLKTALGLPGQMLRDRLLARKFGVRKLRIGSGSFLRGLSHVEMGEDFMAGDGLWLQAVTGYAGETFAPRIQIGNHVRVSHWSHIACTNSVIIGNHVLIGSNVLITDHNHGSFGDRALPPTMPPAERPLDRDRSIQIGNNVWLGDGVVICPGVTMGDGSVAGANAVVTTDVAPFTLVVGAPARAIRRYDAGLSTWVRL